MGYNGRLGSYWDGVDLTAKLVELLEKLELCSVRNGTNQGTPYLVATTMKKRKK